MKNLKDMTDEELALSYVDGNNKAFDLLLSHAITGRYAPQANPESLPHFPKESNHFMKKSDIYICGFMYAFSFFFLYLTRWLHIFLIRRT